MDLHDKRLEAHQKIGTPSEYLGPIETMLTEEARIRGEQYRPEKQAAALGELYQRTAETLAANVQRTVEQIDAEHVKETKELETALKVETSPLPARGLYETETEYRDRVQRRTVEELAKNRHATFAAIDTQIILSTSRPDDVRRILEDAMHAGDVEAIRRIGAVAEMRLWDLARAEARDQPHGARDAFNAHQSVQARMAAWRETEAARSPAVRRQQIAERHQRRVEEARRTAARLATSFELNRQFEGAVRIGALAGKS